MNEILLTVVHAVTFTAKKDNQLYTKLFVPVGLDTTAVITSGDATSLVGEDVAFRLGMRDGNLRLFLADSRSN